MTTTRALFVGVIFLCGLEETLQSWRGLCAGNRCPALVGEREDFAGARRRCELSGGQLYDISSEEAEKTLAGLLDAGGYWLDLHGRGSSLQNCTSISVSTGGVVTASGEPCRDMLDGFLCRAKFSDGCGRLVANSGAQVKYDSAHMGFQIIDPGMSPEGALAVVVTGGNGEHLDSKHMCLSGTWLPAPWTCEVMQGGCEHGCNSTTSACICPAGHRLQPNGLTCAEYPSADWAQGCDRQWGDACVCAEGYRLAPDGRSCADVNECAEDARGELCTIQGEECVNTVGGYECTCKDDFIKEDGRCVDVALCMKCEHDCVKVGGVYACACRGGFSIFNSTMCVEHCTKKDCLSQCDPNTAFHCKCPGGYIMDVRDETAYCTDINECEMKSCDHTCENTFGGYRCSCNEGFELRRGFRCVPIKETEVPEDEGSGSPPPRPSPASASPAAVPSYVKTGSVLGIAVFMALFAALLCVAVRSMTKRCGSFQLPSFRGPDIDGFYLQQVTTDAYKRISFDKQCKPDLQRL